MQEHPLRTILSRIQNGTHTVGQVQLSYRHRGAPLDQLSIEVSDILRLNKGSFALKDGETQIPYHRVLLVKNPRTGEVLWEKRLPEGSSDRAR